MKRLKEFSIFCLTICLPSCFSAKSQSGPEWEYKPRNALVDKATLAGKPLDITVISQGLGMIADCEANWGLLLNSPKKVTIEDVKPFIKQFVTELLDYMYENPLFANRYKEFFKLAKYEKSQLGLNDLAFRLDFWDENVERQLRPYLAEVRLADSTVYYYYTNETTSGLEKVLEEPFFYTPKTVTQ